MNDPWAGVSDGFFGVFVDSYVDVFSAPDFKIKFIGGSAVVIILCFVNSRFFSSSTHECLLRLKLISGIAFRRNHSSYIRNNNKRPNKLFGFIKRENP
jgi:hypothetical protein